MIEKNSGALEGALKSKTDLLSLIAVATLIGFAISTFASIIVEIAATTYVPLLIALVFLVGGFSTLVIQLSRNLGFDDHIRSVVLIDKEENALLPAVGYEFSEDLIRVLRAVETENKAIFGDWERDPIVKAPPKPAHVDEVVEEGGAKPEYVAITRMRMPTNEVRPISANLLEEASFFVLIEEFSTHLSDYFNVHGLEEQTRELRREDISDFLLKNRVLQLLSTPIEQRAIFMHAFPDPGNRPEGEIYALFGSDGAAYNRFDLVLPVQTEVKETAANGLHLDDPRFNLSISAHYTGAYVNISRAFAARYLGVDWDRVAPLEVIINIRGRIRMRSLLRSRGWEYYRWLDTFREKARETFEFDNFLESIHWQWIEPLLYSTRGKIRSEGADVRLPAKDNDE